jgi:negative regulator of sigma E activity
MTRDELEFAISQYLDGNLAAAEESALEARLASDADARALLAQYRGLDRALRGAPLPNIDWDQLAGRIATAVAKQDEPAQSYRLHWVRTAAGLALAACVVIAVSVGIRRLQSPSPIGIANSQTRPQPEPKQIVVIDMAPRAAPSTAPVALVSIGPSAAPQDRAALARYHEDLVSRPSQVIIARSGYSAPDTALLP